MKNKKKLLAAIAALLMAYVGVVYMIPGNQGEEVVKKVADQVEKAAEALPADPE
jgi:hypothetical protein